MVKRIPKDVNNWVLGAIRIQDKQLNTLASVMSDVAYRLEKVANRVDSFAWDLSSQRNDHGAHITANDNIFDNSGRANYSASHIPTYDYPRAFWVDEGSFVFELEASDLTQRPSHVPGDDGDSIHCSTCWEILPCCECRVAEAVPTTCMETDYIADDLWKALPPDVLEESKMHAAITIQRAWRSYLASFDRRRDTYADSGGIWDTASDAGAVMPSSLFHCNLPHGINNDKETLRFLDEMIKEYAYGLSGSDEALVKSVEKDLLPFLWVDWDDPEAPMPQNSIQPIVDTVENGRARLDHEIRDVKNFLEEFHYSTARIITIKSWLHCAEFLFKTCQDVNILAWAIQILRDTSIILD
mmetsp:Transcript_79309/g.144755  ORF Transcript_79309/g.144755 Transcript_79309/m.144755 type:complete len:355 (+) Transcript_79309:190-1254(+)